jgi:hypothetical protein
MYVKVNGKISTFIDQQHFENADKMIIDNMNF